MAKKKEIVHAQVKNPILIRKTILESAIFATEILNSLQKFKKIKKEKQQFRIKLKKELQEIKSLIEKLEIHELPRPPSIPHPSSAPLIKKEFKKEAKKQIKEETKLIETKHSEFDVELKKLQEKLKAL